jgi:hypothetical protein
MTVFTPDSSKIGHERRLLDFEEYYPNGCPMDADTVRALFVILDHVRSQQGEQRNFRPRLAWVDDYC